jgi:hypothetical protein
MNYNEQNKQTRKHIANKCLKEFRNWLSKEKPRFSFETFDKCRLDRSLYNSDEANDLRSTIGCDFNVHFETVMVVTLRGCEDPWD